ncbi:hypothetical protein KAR91_33365 [Candidatus Pacearchaeota archaeon]|nr:hypothetical protein [Candidatus Pacearchaeota archaeon]
MDPEETNRLMDFAEVHEVLSTSDPKYQKYMNDLKDRFVVVFDAWNGSGYECFVKSAKTKKEVTGLVSLILRELTPYCINIIDREGAGVTA